MSRLWIVFCLFLTACGTATKVRYSVTSAPANLPVEVNGVNRGNTPIDLMLECRERWAGLMNSPDGLEQTSGRYVVTVLPTSDSEKHITSQSKSVNPCEFKRRGENPKLFFDLALQRIAPIQRVETKNVDDKLTKSIEALKLLRDQKIITDEEYNKKVLELVK